jgi:thioesterase domain-containing protein
MPQPAQEPEPAAHALRAWRRVSPRAEIETVPGDHLSAVTAHAETLAAILARRLADR